MHICSAANENDKEQNVMKAVTHLLFICFSFRLNFFKAPRKFKEFYLFQVPMVRSEANAYGGEMSGIKSKVSKSVKIK